MRWRRWGPIQRGVRRCAAGGAGRWRPGRAGTPACFGLAALEDSARFCGVDDASIEALSGAMEAIRGRDALMSLLWHVYYQLTVDRLNVPSKDWPTRLAGLDEQSGMLYLVASLAGRARDAAGLRPPAHSRGRGSRDVQGSRLLRGEPPGGSTKAARACASTRYPG